MSEDGKTRYDRVMVDYLKTRVNRTQFLMAGAGVALAAVPGVAGAQSAAPETVQDIINIADTAEHLAVTVLTAAVNNASQLGLTGLLLAFTQAALAEEQYHADFLEKAGAKPLTDEFTVPDPKILTDLQTFLATLEVAETLFIGAYMAAVREFTQLNQPTLAKYAYQIGAVEAEHRAHVRAGEALTTNLTKGVPPNNKAFETNVVATVGDAAKQLQALGFIMGSGTKVTYPGRAAALTAAGPMVAAVLETTPSNSTPSTPTAAYPAPAHRRSHRKPRHRHHKP